MFKELKTAFLMLLVFTLITGVAYPLLVTVFAQVAFNDAANGSLIMRDGKAVGSRLLGQPFSDAGYFWSRPSATGPMPYNGAASSGSNQGPLSPALHEAVEGRLAALREASSPADAATAVPVDLVTASSSGLDPHISPAAARYQIERVATTRKRPAEQIAALVAQHTEPRWLGLLGEPRVNVLELNLALDGLSAK
ncbi:MAG: potassium-transporting ATPase subunit KdpC [Proteobacteria bacterium]|nr:potassium-transporting ATPase subunit KdpC [Burkholderiales bacterium]